jgi:hypothetical protein
LEWKLERILMVISLILDGITIFSKVVRVLPGWVSAGSYLFSKDTAKTAISMKIKNKTYYLVSGITEPITLKTTNVTDYSKVQMEKIQWERLYKRIQDATTVSLVVTE